MKTNVSLIRLTPALLAACAAVAVAPGPSTASAQGYDRYGRFEDNGRFERNDRGHSHVHETAPGDFQQVASSLSRAYGDLAFKLDKMSKYNLPIRRVMPAVKAFKDPINCVNLNSAQSWDLRPLEGEMEQIVSGWPRILDQILPIRGVEEEAGEFIERVDICVGVLEEYLDGNGSHGPHGERYSHEDSHERPVPYQEYRPGPQTPGNWDVRGFSRRLEAPFDSRALQEQAGLMVELATALDDQLEDLARNSWSRRGNYQDSLAAIHAFRFQAEHFQEFTSGGSRSYPPNLREEGGRLANAWQTADSYLRNLQYGPGRNGHEIQSLRYETSRAIADLTTQLDI